MRIIERWRIFACLLSAIVLAFVYVCAAKRDSTTATLLQQAAPGLIVVLIAYVGRYFFLERYAGRPLIARTRAPEAAAVYDSLDQITDLDDLLGSARRMTIVAQYTWTKTYHQALCSFFGAGGHLRLYLMDPSAEDLAVRVAQQINRDGAASHSLQGKVRESIENLRDAYEQGSQEYDRPALPPEQEQAPSRWWRRRRSEAQRSTPSHPQIELIFVDHMINYFGVGFSWRNPRSRDRQDEALITFLHNHFPRSLPWTPGVCFDLPLVPSISKFWHLELHELAQLSDEKKKVFTSFQAALDYVSDRATASGGH